MRMGTSLWVIVVVAMLSAGPAMACAVTINYTTVHLGANVYGYEWSVVNTLAIPIYGFTIFFDWGDELHAIPDYQGILDDSTAEIQSKWSTLVADPLLPGVTDPGYFDSLVILPADAIPAGGILGGFAAAFEWSGTGTPGSQFFQVYDQNGDLAFTGQTIPEPTTFLMMMVVGLCGLLARRR